MGLGAKFGRKAAENLPKLEFPLKTASRLTHSGRVADVIEHNRAFGRLGGRAGSGSTYRDRAAETGYSARTGKTTLQQTEFALLPHQPCFNSTGSQKEVPWEEPNPLRSYDFKPAGNSTEHRLTIVWKLICRLKFVWKVTRVLRARVNFHLIFGLQVNVQ